MSSESQMRAYNAGAQGQSAAFVAPEDMAAYHAGLLSQPRGGGSGGGLMLMAAFLGLPLVLVAGACIYPLAGALTLVGAALLSDLMDGVNGLGMWLFLMVPCLVLFALGMGLEHLLERWAVYRWLRHAARLLMVGFVTHVIVFAFRGAGEFSEATPFLARLSLAHVAIVLAAMGVAHLLSRWLDARLGTAQQAMARFRLRRKPVA